MKIRLAKSTKYKGKILTPGIYEVTKKKGMECIKLGIANEIETLNSSANKNKSTSEVVEEGLFYQLQAEAKALGIDTEGKSFEDLKSEVDNFA
jgi:hypothetical protein